MTRHWCLNSRHIWLEIYFKISNNLKIGQICPRCVQKSLRAPNKLFTGVRGAYFSSFLKYNFNKTNLFLLRFVPKKLENSEKKAFMPSFNQALWHCFSGKKEIIQKIIIRSYSFCGKGTSFYLQSSENGIFDLLISELFGSLVYEQEIYIKRIWRGNLPQLSFQIL